MFYLTFTHLSFTPIPYFFSSPSYSPTHLLSLVLFNVLHFCYFFELSSSPSLLFSINCSLYHLRLLFFLLHLMFSFLFLISTSIYSYCLYYSFISCSSFKSSSLVLLFPYPVLYSHLLFIILFNVLAGTVVHVEFGGNRTKINRRLHILAVIFIWLSWIQN